MIRAITTGWTAARMIPELNAAKGRPKKARIQIPVFALDCIRTGKKNRKIDFLKL